MAKQTIDLGTTPNRGDGDPLRTAFRKINENFNELYAGDFAAPDQTASDVVPSVDSTYDLGSAERQWADLYVNDFIYLNDARIEIDANGNLLVGGKELRNITDIQGSVFADDSTLLVDGVNGVIVGPVDTTTVIANEVVAGQITSSTQTVSPLVYTQLVEGAQGLDLVLRTYNVASGTANDVLLSGGESADTGFGFGGSVKIQGGENAERSQGHGAVEIGTEHTNGVTIGAYDFGDGFGNVVHLAGFQVLIGEASNRSTTFMKGAVDFSEATVSGLDVALTGDLSGSVFADDSTLLVDGVNGTIPYSVLSDAPTALSNFSNDLDYAAIVATQIQTSGLPINTTATGDLTVNGNLQISPSSNITFKTEQDPGTWNDGSIETSFYSYLLNFPTNQPAVTAPLIVGWNDYAYIQPFLPTDIGASEATQGRVKRSLLLSGGNATDSREPGLVLISGGQNSSAGLWGDVGINTIGGDVDIGNASGTITIDGNTTVNKQLTVEESFSSTPTTKFFEIETGAGNNRLLRTGVNMSAFAQGDGPQLDLTSYRSSPANGDAGPELVLRASTGASANDVIATIGTQVTDTTDGDVTSKISFTVQNNGAEITPLSITGSTVDMQTADQVSISNSNGDVDVFGEVEFHGRILFQDGDGVDFNGPVDFTSATFTGEPWISLATLKAEVAASTDFEDFQSRIAAL